MENPIYNIIMYTYRCRYLYEHFFACIHDSAGVSDPLELEFQTVVSYLWVLGVEPDSSGRAPSLQPHARIYSPSLYRVENSSVIRKETLPLGTAPVHPEHTMTYYEGVSQAAKGR